MTENNSSGSLNIKSTNEVSLIQRTLWLLNTFYNQVVAVFTLVFLWISFSQSRITQSFLWHVVLSTIAYVPLMAVAIILFSEDNMVTLYIRRTKRYWIHGVLLLISSIAVSVGIGLETHSKSTSDRNQGHFKSTHAILGLVSWIAVLVAVIIGLVAANTKTFKSFIRPVIVKFLHNFFGIAGFVLGVASLYKELHFVENCAGMRVYTGIRVALGFITIWSLLAALKSLWNQLRGIFS